MQILVKSSSDGPLLHIQGTGIAGTARWRGGPVPAPGVRPSVELEITAVVPWTKIAVGETRGLTDPPDGQLVLTGTVEDIDHQGVLILRVGNGVVLIDTSGEPPLGVVGQQIATTISDVEIFPTGV